MTEVPWTTLLWDLDGTITDPRKGIIGAYLELFKELGTSSPKEEDLLWVIGPPLRECIKKLLPVIQTNEQLEDAVQRYRHWYVNKGLMYLDTPYDGISKTLSELKTKNVRMFVATAKAHPYARQILDHWRLSQYFEAIHGSELDGTRAHKADLLGWVLEQNKIQPSKKVVMIGDRRHDALAGQTHGLYTIGIGYGYGSEAELRDSGVDLYCRTLSDLRKSLNLK
ncbi:MAG: HAD hydrolase-like protein [Proteobacteria bacterium]|nr:HAD hydrolase-like protein [Pseudomonadota bacterium]